MLKLEVGKTYVTADGTPVKIVSKDDHPDFPFDGSNGDCYRADGRCDGVPCRRDLVSELVEPGAAATTVPNAQAAEHRGFFLDQLMFELIRLHTDAPAGWIADRFAVLADARATR